MLRKRLLGFLLIAIFGCCLFSGCGELPAEYDIYVYVNGANYGTVEDVSGTYTEGNTVTITANPKNGQEFFGWMHDNQLISTKSVHSFVVNSKTAGSYIALFKSPIMEYVYLDNFSYINNIPQQNGDTIQTLSEITISFGTTLNEMQEIYTCSGESLPTVENTSVAFETIYSENTTPFAFDRTKTLYIKITVKYTTELEGNELEYISETIFNNPASEIEKDIKNVSNKNLDVVKNTTNSNLILAQNVTDDEVVLYNQISLTFKSLANFPLLDGVDNEDNNDNDNNDEDNEDNDNIIDSDDLIPDNDDNNDDYNNDPDWTSPIK